MPCVAACALGRPPDDSLAMVAALVRSWLASGLRGRSWMAASSTPVAITTSAAEEGRLMPTRRALASSPIPAGTRRHVVTLENPGPAVPDGDGGYTQTWTPLSPPFIYAHVASATARDLERVAAGTVMATATHIITGPYHPDVTTQTRLTWVDRFGRTHTANVTGPSDAEGRGIEMQLVCVEAVE